jgi:hypothetical protein
MFCGYCGSPVGSDHGFCTKCGKAIRPDTPTQADLLKELGVLLGDEGKTVGASNPAAPNDKASPKIGEGFFDGLMEEFDGDAEKAHEELQRRLLFDLSQRLYAVVEGYVSIHNDVLRRRWFRTPDYGKHCKELAELSVQLAYLQVQADDLKEGRTPEDLLFLEQALVYIPCVSSAVFGLTHICDQMRRKYEGKSGYSWFRFRSDWRMYEERVQKYRTEGQRLNDLYNAVLKPTGIVKAF